VSGKHNEHKHARRRSTNLQLSGGVRLGSRARVRHEVSQDPGGILLIVEVSSKLQKKTEELGMRILKRGFASYIFIAVAHHVERRKL